MIQIRELSKTFVVHRKAPGLLASLRSLLRREKVEKAAVRRVSFDVGEGEIVGLIGANGAGKTTLVKMLAGIIHPTSGDAEVLGFRPWERRNEFRRQISLIMGQKAQLWWDLPAADCFLLLQEIYQIPPRDFQERLEELAGMLDVEKELHVQIRRLSLGERMKMELIAALLHRPRIVYLDEPTIGLDLTAQRAIRDFILDYRERYQPAMILTSHYMEDIERLCRRIVILREGEVVYDGTLRRVMETYAQHKVITAHLKKTSPPSHPPRVELPRLGEVLECDDLQIRLKVVRSEVAAAAATLLREYPVADVHIDEVDIGTVIEMIQQDRLAAS